jgi:hypothetical protein
MTSLWTSHRAGRLGGGARPLPEVVARQGRRAAPELDAWYRGELAGAVLARRPAQLALPELVRLTEWKMARGAWRAPNLARVRANPPDAVAAASAAAFAAAPHPTRPIAALAELDGVGPATASAALAAVAPAHYPFFDELVVAQLPDSARWRGRSATTGATPTRCASARPRSGAGGPRPTPSARSGRTPAARPARGRRPTR